MWSASSNGPTQRPISVPSPLCNAGGLCARAQDMRRWLSAVRNDNAKREYYLTDVVAIARSDGVRVAALEAPAADVAGINSRAELAAAEAVVQQRLRAAAWTPAFP